MTSGTNDITVAYAKAQRDMRCTYTLGVYDRSGKLNNKRRLTSKLKGRKGLRVVYPQYFIRQSPEKRKKSLLRTAGLTPPQVVSVTPVNGAIQVDPATVVTVTFDEDISATPDLAGLITLTGPVGPVAGVTTLQDPVTAVFTPDAPLAVNFRFTVAVNGAADASGNVQTVAFGSTDDPPANVARGQRAFAALPLRVLHPGATNEAMEASKRLLYEALLHKTNIFRALARCKRFFRAIEVDKLRPKAFFAFS